MSNIIQLWKPHLLDNIAKLQNLWREGLMTVGKSLKRVLKQLKTIKNN